MINVLMTYWLHIIAILITFIQLCNQYPLLALITDILRMLPLPLNPTHINQQDLFMLKRNMDTSTVLRTT